MRYNTIKYNDVANSPGIAVSVYVQGCKTLCKNCHNPEAQSFDGGKEFTYEVLESIIRGLTANGIHRSLCILGGEPMCEENTFLTLLIINEVRRQLPDTKIYIWTGYYIEKLLKSSDPKIRQILEQADVLVDGPYIDKLRDITLPMRGSSNQRIIDLKKFDFEKNI